MDGRSRLALGILIAMLLIIASGFFPRQSFREVGYMACDVPRALGGREIAALEEADGVICEAGFQDVRTVTRFYGLDQRVTAEETQDRRGPMSEITAHVRSDEAVFPAAGLDGCIANMLGVLASADPGTLPASPEDPTAVRLICADATGPD
ncbi:MAG: hypothetical protein AAF914_03485 [Pseudomonadota bacterium]